jgi:hypothetical protein
MWIEEYPYYDIFQDIMLTIAKNLKIYIFLALYIPSLSYKSDLPESYQAFSRYSMGEQSHWLVSLQ